MTTSMDSFVQLSALLTGIAADKLAPQIDPNNIKQAYFDHAQAMAGADLARLLAIFDGQQGQPAASIAELILNQSGDDIRDLARAIMLAWYLGSWYPVPAAQAEGTVISAAAYTQGWAWSVAQAHPMGYSNGRFGYWAGNPVSLSALVGGPQA